MSSRDTLWIEVLSEEWTGPVSLRIQGRSMWPTLRPGDQVTIEPVDAADLRPGDWVALRRSEALILHRFLGFDRDGRLVTKGDRLRHLDAPWPPGALLGRVVAHCRQGEALPVSSNSFRARALTHFHRLSGRGWLWLHRAKRALLPVLLLCLSLAPPAQASVDLLSFEATVVGQAILVTWQTASEIDMRGFYLQRAFEESGDYQPITDLILATGDPLGGGSYDYLDTNVVEGSTYWYKLVAVEMGGTSEDHGPVSATMPAAPTPTFTPTPTPTSTPTPTPTHTPSPTPAPTNTPSVTPTASPTVTSTPAPTHTPVPGTTPTLTSPASTSTPAPAASLAPTASPPAAASAAPTGSPAAQPSPTLTPTPTPTPTVAPAVAEQPPKAEALPESDAATDESLVRAERLRNWVLIAVFVVVLVLLAGVGLLLGLYALYRWRRLRQD